MDQPRRMWHTRIARAHSLVCGEGRVPATHPRIEAAGGELVRDRFGNVRGRDSRSRGSKRPWPRIAESESVTAWH